MNKKPDLWQKARRISTIQLLYGSEFVLKEFAVNIFVAALVMLQ